MKNIIFCLLTIFLFGCKSEIKQEKLAINHSPYNTPNIYSVPNEVILKDGSRYKNELYNLTLNSNKVDDYQYDLKIMMELLKNSFFVSPNAKRDFKGKFTFSIDKNDFIEQIDYLIENPLSKETYDSHPFVRGKINWVRDNTLYTQKIKRLTDDDFQVKGFIQFTIEPKCTLEKIPFIIKYTNNELKIEIFGC